MARRRPKPRPAGPATPPEFLIIRFDGPAGSGVVTTLEAVRMLLADAGFRVEVGVRERAGGSDPCMLAVKPDATALDDLRDWMKGEPA